MDKQKILSLLQHIAELLEGADNTIDPAEKKANDTDPAANVDNDKNDDKPAGDGCGDLENKVGDQDPTAAPGEKESEAQAAGTIVNSEAKEAPEAHPAAPDGQVVMDAALVTKLQNDAVHAARKAFQAQGLAARECRTVLGEVDPLVFDSAEDIYGKALAQLGYDLKAYPRAAWRGMVQVATNMKRDHGTSPTTVHDSALSGNQVEVKGVDSIRIG